MLRYVSFGRSFDVGTNISSALRRCSSTLQSEQNSVTHHNSLRNGTPDCDAKNFSVKAGCRNLDGSPAYRNLVVLLTTIGIGVGKVEKTCLDAVRTVRLDCETKKLSCIRRHAEANLRGFRP
jgi:hypothetical protein